MNPANKAEASSAAAVGMSDEHSSPASCPFVPAALPAAALPAACSLVWLPAPLFVFGFESSNSNSGRSVLSFFLWYPRTSESPGFGATVTFTFCPDQIQFWTGSSITPTPGSVAGSWAFTPFRTLLRITRPVDALGKRPHSKLTRQTRTGSTPRGTSSSMRMRKMSGAWESFTRSRMATLAVNALLLGSGRPSCRAAAAAASAGAGWSDPGASVLRALSSAAALPHDLGRRSAPSSPAAGDGGLFGRHSGGAQESHAPCETKRPSGEQVRRRSWRGRAAAGSAARNETKNMHARAGRPGRRPAGAGRAEQAERQRKGGLLRGVLGVRAASAATGGEEAGGARETFGGSSGGGGGVRQWMERLGRSTASCDREQHQQHHPRQQQREGSVYTRTAAVINAAIRMPSAAGSAAAVAAAPPTSPSPVPSYLRWRDAAGPEDSESDDVQQQKPNKKELPLGVGSRAGRPSSSKEAAAAPSAEEEGSLEAAKTSRGGGGAGAVSLSFKEAMFAGAVSRSIAQVRLLYPTPRALRHSPPSTQCSSHGRRPPVTILSNICFCVKISYNTWFETRGNLL